MLTDEAIDQPNNAEDREMPERALNVLFILRFPPSVQRQYLDGTKAAVPEASLVMTGSTDEADPHLADADVLVTFGPMLGARSEHIFRRATSLKWVQSLGTGVDNIIDVPTLKPNVIVTKLHGIHGPPVSEAAITSMLALARDFPQYVKHQQAATWSRPRPPALLHGKTAGIFGIGSIAEALAPRLGALGMKVVGVTSAVREVPGFDEVVSRDRMLGVLPGLDHFIILTPLSDATRNAVAEAELAAMKPSAYLINLARGGVVDEDALIGALDRGTIAGAALDVFATEPLPPDHPFWRMDNVIVTPHVGGFNEDYPQAALPVFTENLKRFMAGERRDLINLVERG
jgi:phosphoglycerate dehydrogenase-like enzyme